MHRSLRTHPLAATLLSLAVAVPLVLAGCTDLDEEVFGAVTAENFYQTEGEVLAAVAPVYAQLRGTLGDYHNVSQVSSDENVVPTRGSDWFDGGVWLATHRQTWDPNLGFLNGVWVNAYTGVARANTVLETLEGIDVPNKETIVAELRALRAFYYYQLMDFFGGVPIVTASALDPENLPVRNTRAETFDFIVEELTAARAALPEQWPANSYGRVTKYAADALLANMYINAAVFTQPSTDISIDGYNSCASVSFPGGNACELAIQHVDNVINSGYYSLAENWFSIFGPNNNENPEHIFVVAHLPEDGLGMNFQHRALHYNQFTPSPWNGFSTLAETYNAFAEEDLRRAIFLEGLAFNVLTGEPVLNRQNEPLVFTINFDNITNAAEGEGARIYKFPVDPDHEGPNNGNDYPFFRLGEMLLIKAEALNELGRTAEAVALVNLLRERVADADLDALPDPDPGAFLLDPADFDQASFRAHLLDERLFELTYEAKRRQDLVRYGRFDDPWSFKDASPQSRVLFPIPQVQRDANPALEQNPGY